MNPFELLAEGKTTPTLAEARAAARRVLAPPAEGLGRLLSQLAAAWSADWTAILKSHPLWHTARESLRSAMSLLDGQQIADAEDEILSLLSKCCPPIQQALPNMMTSLRGVEAAEPSPDIRREALTRFVQWLEQLV